ncbi:helix-turn-helix domain-containing protein [Rubrivivax sp. RP6-9]|uniref:helix-turn-helix domain-containing protein n=1 Tax=Rubrivivax sp. RP6-9 TaxID=3415750 RepID=UPI003CC571F0
MQEDPIQHVDATALGQSLRRWRALRRMKQSHAAELLGVSQPTISRWESGTQTPDEDEQQVLRRLMAARLDSAADHALARLVNESPLRVHLVCDLTHRLLALSRGREAECRRPRSEMMGRSLWRYASAEIVRAERSLSDRGWFSDNPPELTLTTSACLEQDVLIPSSRFRWVRFQLSDGSHARLVETLETPGVMLNAGPATHRSTVPADRGTRAP